MRAKTGGGSTSQDRSMAADEKTSQFFLFNLFLVGNNICFMQSGRIRAIMQLFSHGGMTKMSKEAKA